MAAFKYCASFILVVVLLISPFVNSQETNSIPDYGFSDRDSEILEKVEQLTQIIQGNLTSAHSRLMAESMATIRSLVHNNTELVKRVAVLESQVAAAATTTRDLKERYEQHTERQEQQHKLELDNCNLRVEFAQSQAKRAREDLDQLQSTKKSPKPTSSSSELEILRHNYTELLHVNARLGLRFEQIHELNAQLLSECRERTAELKNTTRSLQNERDDLTAELEQERNRSENLTATNVELENTLEAQETEGEREKQALNRQFEISMTEVRGNASSSEERATRLLAELQTLSEEHVATREQLVNVTEQLTEATAGQQTAKQQLGLVLTEFHKFKKSCYRIIYWG